MTPSHIPSPPPQKPEPKPPYVTRMCMNIAGLASGVALLIHGGHHNDSASQTAGASILVAVVAVAFARQHGAKGN